MCVYNRHCGNICMFVLSINLQRIVGKNNETHSFRILVYFQVTETNDTISFVLSFPASNVLC